MAPEISGAWRSRNWPCSFARLDVDDVTGRKHLAHALDRLCRTARRLRPFDALERQDADFTGLDQGAAGVTRRLQTDARRLIVDLEHHREPPGIDIGQRLHVAKLDAPVAAHVDLADRAAPALGFVEIDQPVDHGLARQHLDLGIERGAHGEPALVELFLPVVLEDVAPHLLGEIFGRESMRPGRPHGDAERLLLGFFAGLGGDVAVLDHAVDHVVAPCDRLVVVAERIVIVRALGQRGEVGGLGDCQLVDRFVEIEERCGSDTVGAEAEKDLIEIELEDLVLRVGPLNTQREQRFLDLARD